MVCTRLKVVRSADQLRGTFYLTNTVYTQVYCTGAASLLLAISITSSRYSFNI